MTEIPSLPVDLAAAQQQAIAGIRAAIAAGYRRIQVDLVGPELKPETVALPLVLGCDPPLTVVFSDAGSAALAQRDWPQLPDGIQVASLGAGFRVEAGSSLFFVVPSVYAVEQVEQVCQDYGAGSQGGAILFNPQLQDAATVGVGLAGRRLRDRFIKTFESAYYLQALGSTALCRLFPHPWGVWQQTDVGDYQLLQTLDHKPNGEELSQIVGRDQGGASGLLSGIRQFLRALQG